MLGLHRRLTKIDKDSMKQVDFIKIFLGIAISALFGYVCYLIDKGSIGNLIVPAITLALLTSSAAIKFEKHNYMMKVVMWIGILVQIASSLLFVIKIHNPEIMIVTLSLIVLLVLSLSYLIYRS